ncbi:hypothetical protein LCGC14_2296920 [marine sediment metagenome]|uniref:Uncharacterized protein n=1 Tax=marine sediment metagenome TaxID=412755 RepID=A0A0F9CPM7_9ZZZZ
MENTKTKCPRCNQILVFDTITYNNENFLVARCCGSCFSELIADFGLQYNLLTPEEIKSKIAEIDFSAYVTQTRTSEVKKDLLTCFKCGDKMREGDAERWYHGDQDDLICQDCAFVTKHTDTILAGQPVLELIKQSEDKNENN